MFDVSDTCITENLIVTFIEEVILPYGRSTDYYVDWRINNSGLEGNNLIALAYFIKYGNIQGNPTPTLGVREVREWCRHCIYV